MKARAIVILAFMALALVPAARAHSRIVAVQVQTAAGSEARVLTVRFDAPIEVRFSRFALVVEGRSHDLKAVARDGKQRSTEIELRLPDVAADEAILRWNLLSSDGHREKGERTVKLG